MKGRYLVREFSRLTRVTVRTLHYYDAIGLLSPAERTPGGARLYTEKDLVRLQQIITLKFMGFSLGEARRILDQPGYSVRKALRVQARAIEEEIARLRRASRALGQSIRLLENSRRLDWRKVVTIMEAVQMSEDRKTEWAEEFFTAGEMREFRKAGRSFGLAEMEAYQKEWAELLAAIERSLDIDPAGPKARGLARRWKELFEKGWGGRPGLARRIGRAYEAGAVPPGLGPSARAFDFIRRVEAAAGKRPGGAARRRR
jgi:DNA-binding transcriptional MerR regulator